MRREVARRIAAREATAAPDETHVIEDPLENPTWTKIRKPGPRQGEWGARIEAPEPPSPGDRIEMFRQDGTRSIAIVDEIISSFRDAQTGKMVHVAALQQEKAPVERRPPERWVRPPAVPPPVEFPPRVEIEPEAPPRVEPVPGRTWSAYQLAIFEEVVSGRGHMVVLARAGAGKTTTAEEAIRRVPSSKTVLFTSFARKIMAEIETRFRARPAPNVEIAGLNSYGNRQVRASFRGIQFDNDKLYKLSEGIVGDGSRRGDYDRAARSALLKLVALMKATLAYSDEQADALIDKYEISAGDVFNIEDDPVVRSKFIQNAIRLLDSAKADTTRIDFDDQIWLPIILNLPIRGGYDFVFIDETQDLTPAQLELSMRATRKGGRIVAIGDDRQSIFAFRGADEEAIPHIIERLRAKILKLTISYRCAKCIAEAARAIVPDFESGRAEEGVCEVKPWSAMFQDAMPGDFILSRTNAPLVKVCWALLRAGKKASIAGRDLGKGLIQLVERAQKKGKVTNVIELQAWISKWAATEVERLLAKKPPRETEADAVADKVATVDVLAQGTTEIAEVVQKIEDLFSDDTSETRIICSSTHKAKGLERERVWILRNTYRKRPGTQEDNLWYVGVTRAKTCLYYVDVPTDRDEE